MAVKKKVAKKSVTKAPAVKKEVTTKKKVAKKKVAAAAPAKKLTSIATRQTKAQIVTAIAEDTGLTKAQVASVFANLGELIQRHMQARGSGEFTIPDAGVKVKRVIKPARKARMGRNPFTGEEVKIAAKPKSKAVKCLALTALKKTIA
jgi:nucleoid DNA-binding protein